MNAGTASVEDGRTVPDQWDEAATTLPLTPSKESMREVKREAHQRQMRFQASARVPRQFLPSQKPKSRMVIVLTAILVGVVAFGLHNVYATERRGASSSIAPPLRHSFNLGTLSGFLLLWIVFYFLIVFLVARSAGSKGRSPLAWFILAWFFPVISWIIVATMTPSLEAIDRRSYRKGEASKCPHCREIVKRGATVCRYCGRSI
jgi:hypothetical protein